MKFQTALTCMFAVSAATLIASDKPHFESSPRLDAVTIDGKFDDWPGNLEPFADKPLSIQFQNDGEFLYLRFSASDAAARAQILRQGLTVWFDPAGGTKKHFGVRYPVVDQPQYSQGGRTGGYGGGGYGGGGNGGYGGSRRAGGDRDRPEGGSSEGEPSTEPSPTERVDILGPGKGDARELTRSHLQGIDVALRTVEGVLQYELKVPLEKSPDHPNAIEAVSGKPIGFGFETPKANQTPMSYGRGGGMGGFGGGRGGHGGMGGYGGGMGRHGGGGGERDNNSPPKPLNGWGTVSLATAQAR